MTDGWRDEDFANEHAFLSAVREAAADLGERPIELSDPGSLDAIISERAPVATPTPREFREHARREQFWPYFLVWRSLERLGRFAPEHDDDYVLALVGLASRRGRPRAIERLLRDDRELREHTLWRIFEVEGGGEVSFTRGEPEWTDVLSALSADGTIERARVLRSALAALGRDYSSYRAGGFRRLYDALCPTTDERATDQDLLWPLFSASVTQTVSWAVQAVTTLGRAGRLDDAAFVAAAPPAVQGTKAAALAAVKLLATIAARRADLAGDADLIIADALGHADASVQDTALTVLRRRRRDDLVQAGVDLLAPSVRAAHGFGGENAGDGAPLDGENAADGAAPDVACPQPIADADDTTVADVLPRAIEGAADALAVEAVLARIALVGLDTTLATTLRRRALAVLHRETSAVQRVAATVVVAWTAEDADAIAADWDLDASATRRGENHLWPLSIRTAEIVALAARRATGVTLWATATDDAGGVDAGVLVTRAIANPEPTEADTAAALLRLRPDGRAAALGAAAGIPGSAADALRFALGGAAPDADAVRASPRVWQAAARARADRSILTAVGLDAAGWGAPQTAAIVRHEHRWGEQDQFSAWQLGIDVALPPPTLPDAWTVRSAGSGGFYVDDRLLAPEWSPYTAPDDLEPFASTLLVALTKFVAWDEVDRRILPALAALRRTSGRPGTLASACVALALGARKPDVRAEGIELFADMITRRDALDAVVAGGRAVAVTVNAQRWASALGEAAGMSVALASAVRVYLTGVLPAFERGHQRIGTLLQVLLDESVRARVGVTDRELRDWLSGFTGSSVAAKAARALLAIG